MDHTINLQSETSRLILSTEVTKKSPVCPKTALVIQALKALGKDNIDESVITKLKKQLSSEEKDNLIKEARQTTAWVYSVIRKICEAK